MKCKCGSGLEDSPHYYAGIYIGNSCCKCWQKNDDKRTKELMTPTEWKRWKSKISRKVDI